MTDVFGAGPGSVRMVALSSLEYAAATLIFGWGFWLLSWGSDAAISAASFAALRASVESLGIGPAWRVVGLAAIGVGALYAVAVWINGRGKYWTPFVRSLAALGASSFLFGLSWGIAQVQPSSTGVFTYAALGIAYFQLFRMNSQRTASTVVDIAGLVRGRFG